jgi:hypothetical protein
MLVLALPMKVCKNRIPNETLSVNCPQEIFIFFGKKKKFRISLDKIWGS